MPSEIPRTPVESSLLHSVGYDEASTTLAVQFHKDVPSGRVYHYDGVSPEDFAAMTGAESIGRHFLKHVKPAFPAEKIDKPADDESGGD